MAAPAERISMSVALGSEQQTTRIEILDDEWIRLFDKDSAPRCHFRNKCPVWQNGHQYRQIVFRSDLNNKPRASRSSMMNGSASLTKTPRHGVTSGINVPSGRTVINTGRLCSDLI